MTSTRQAGLVGCVLVLLLALIAVGCGSGDSVPEVATLRGVDDGGAQGTATGLPPAASARDEELSTEQALLKLTRCLRKEGLDVPDPKVDAQGNLQLLFGQDVQFDPSSAKAQAAFKTCQQYIEGIVQSFTADDLVELRDTLVKYAACVRKNGYDLPDPNFLNPNGPFGKVDRKDPRFKQADVKCRYVLEEIQEVFDK